MPAAGAEHRDGVPVGGLDQHVRGGVGHLGVLAAHHAAEADDAGVVGDDEVLGRQRAVVAVERGEALALGGAADADRSGELVGVVPVDRAAELEHHVVGDVDGQRDRTLAEQHQPARHPRRRRRGRVEVAHGPGHEDGAALGVVDHDRVAVVVGGRDVPVGRVVEGRAVRQGRLAGDAAQRQRVGAVGVDLELDDLVAQVQQVEDVVAGLPGVGREHDDARVVLTQAELLGGADHAGGDVAVGLARGDLEATGQHAAGEDDDHEVAGREVVRAADDALGLAGAVGVADVDRAPVDRLAVLLRLGLHRQHAADHERPGDVVAGSLERLELEAERGQPVGEVLGGHVGREVGVLADPGEGAFIGVPGEARAQRVVRWGGHSSLPKAVEKRTSPSNMSRMSATPWRNIRVRSMPMPNAKPV